MLLRRAFTRITRQSSNAPKLQENWVSRRGRSKIKKRNQKKNAKQHEVKGKMKSPSVLYLKINVSFHLSPFSRLKIQEAPNFSISNKETQTQQIQTLQENH